MLIAAQGALNALLTDIAIAARSPLHDRPRKVAEAIGAHLLNPELLAGRHCACCPDRYVRHLLYADPAGSYAAVALVWRPGQMSPIHAHRTWCAFGVHRGVLTEGFYRFADNDPPQQSSSALRAPGSVCHGPADPHQIHRLANLGSDTALSIHVYGAPFERFGEDVNLIYEA